MGLGCRSRVWGLDTRSRTPAIHTSPHFNQNTGGLSLSLSQKFLNFLLLFNRPRQGAPDQDNERNDSGVYSCGSLALPTRDCRLQTNVQDVVKFLRTDHGEKTHVWQHREYFK